MATSTPHKNISPTKLKKFNTNLNETKSLSLENVITRLLSGLGTGKRYLSMLSS